MVSTHRGSISDVKADVLSLPADENLASYATVFQESFVVNHYKHVNRSTSLPLAKRSVMQINNGENLFYHYLTFLFLIVTTKLLDVTFEIQRWLLYITEQSRMMHLRQWSS